MKNVILPLLVSLFFLRCAHQVAPSGGPEDTTPPREISSFPKNGDINVPTDASISILFSEWISPYEIKRKISLSPILTEGYTVTVSAKKIIIKPNEKLEDSTTYHVFINNLSDIHNVKTPSTVELIFSTGSKLDSCTISGHVEPYNNEKIPFTVSLFKQKRIKKSYAEYFSEPDYTRITDSSGNFEFTGLRKDNYAIVAFSDVNNNNKIDVSESNIYTTLSEFIQIRDSLKDITLYKSSLDTITTKLSDVKSVANNILMCKVSGNKNNILEAYIISANSKIPCSIENVKFSDRIYLKIKKHLSKNQYKLIYSSPIVTHIKQKKTVVIKQDSLHSDTIAFNCVSTQDTIKPICFIKNETDTIPLSPKIKLNFSKPVRIIEQISGFVTDSSETVEVSTDTIFSEKIQISSKTKLKPGTKYTLELKSKEFATITGTNPIFKKIRTIKNADTLTYDTTTEQHIRITILTASPDSIAISLEGSAGAIYPNPTQSVWKFNYINRKVDEFSISKFPNFHFSSLPYGLGTISCFEDLDSNMQITFGKLFPFKKPERYRFYSDTIEARARWEITNIKIGTKADKK